MKDDLLPYYEHELSFIRNAGKEFAENYKKIAGRLLLEPDKCDDPHVERLIESFALIAGRIHHKIDDEFPQITEALINMQYPHYLRPIPSFSIAQFRAVKNEGASTSAHLIPSGTVLNSQPVSGAQETATFRTCTPVKLWPIQVIGAAVVQASALSIASVPEQAFAAIRIDLACPLEAPLSKLDLTTLRFYLNGQSHIVHTLYELLFASVISVGLYGTGPQNRPLATQLPANCLNEVGFRRDESLLPYPDTSFAGYRLLQEYVNFPEKFLFFDVSGLDRIDRADFGSEFSIYVFLRSFERKQRLQQLTQTVSAATFALGCAPIVNLFERTAEPIRLTHARAEYPVVADVHRPLTTEVYSIERVNATATHLATPREFAPFYSLRHAYGEASSNAFWYASRRPSGKKGDNGTDVFLTFVDPAFQPSKPAAETLTIRVTCTNRDFAGQMPFRGDWGELFPEDQALVEVRALLAPTRSVRPPLRSGLQWRLISHLSLNYLSIVNGGREALQEILRLYDFTDSPVLRRQISGLVSIDAAPGFARVISEFGVHFVQGTNVEMTLDEDDYVGSGVFLTAAVLERFLALYSGLNSYSQLTVKTRQRKEDLKKWPPRRGEQILL